MRDFAIEHPIITFLIVDCVVAGILKLVYMLKN